jgi:hypothetical protein
MRPRRSIYRKERERERERGVSILTGRLASAVWKTYLLGDRRVLPRYGHVSDANVTPLVATNDNRRRVQWNRIRIQLR